MYSSLQLLMSSFPQILVNLRPSPKCARRRPGPVLLGQLVLVMLMTKDRPHQPRCMGRRNTTFSLMVELHRTLHCAKLSLKTPSCFGGTRCKIPPSTS
ncbi:unnamed protein product [Brassica napus]|uniref:(rape) hypothetical protein n=1 Tax=Brassica napus TaxID=3708 RepID=A0A816XXE6_BRANA|nr:unnamed protein product [Brassica napus]